jgi:hypothetical protein
MESFDSYLLRKLYEKVKGKGDIKRENRFTKFENKEVVDWGRSKTCFNLPDY